MGQQKNWRILGPIFQGEWIPFYDIEQKDGLFEGCSTRANPWVKFDVMSHGLFFLGLSNKQKHPKTIGMPRCLEMFLKFFEQLTSFW